MTEVPLIWYTIHLCPVCTGTLKPQRRLMGTQRLMQLMQVKMDGHLLGDDDVATRQQDQLLRMMEDDTGFHSIFGDLAEYAEEELAAQIAKEGAEQGESEQDESEEEGAEEEAPPPRVPLDLFDV